MKTAQTGARDPEHEFILILSNVPALTSEVENALFEAGCDDATVGMHSGRMAIDFLHVLAPNTQRRNTQAAIRDVQKAKIGRTNRSRP